jgi:hypothetical protein
MINDVGQFGEPVKSSVLIVDDHPLVRLGLVDLINAEADLAVCCEAASSPAALRMMRMCPPECSYRRHISPWHQRDRVDQDHESGTAKAADFGALDV